VLQAESLVNGGTGRCFYLLSCGPPLPTFKSSFIANYRGRRCFRIPFVIGRSDAGSGGHIFLWCPSYSHQLGSHWAAARHSSRFPMVGINRDYSSLSAATAECTASLLFNRVGDTPYVYNVYATALPGFDRLAMGATFDAGWQKHSHGRSALTLICRHYYPGIGSKTRADLWRKKAVSAWQTLRRSKTHSSD